MKPSRPLLRWHGGKWRLSSWIIEHFPPHRVYTEAYGGAGSVLIKKPRAYSEIWNDLDQEVVTLFRVLRNKKQSRELRKALYLTPFSHEEFRLSYEAIDDPLEKARRLIIRCYMGFGTPAHNRKYPTGFRANAHRSHTTPAHDWINYPGALAATIKRLRGVTIENKEALKILTQHDGEDTLHYVDPPYVHVTRSGFDKNKRYSFEMSDQDHRKLAAVLKKLKGMVVLSGYPGRLYEKLYSGWKSFGREAMADGARKRLEVLWLNRAAWDRLKKGKK